MKHHHEELERTSGFVPLVFNSTGSPVKRSPDYPHLSYSHPADGAACEVIYPNGVRLRLPQGTDVRELEQLIHLYR